MPRIIHARIDGETEKLLSELQQRMDWSDSKVIREGIQALGALLVPQRPRRIIGLGRFRSGIPDLATNPEHLEDFGR